MNSVVIYASRSGNTGRLASAIADALKPHGPVELVAADAAPTYLAAGTDLIVVGGPTEGHGMTEPVVHFFDALAATALDGVAAAAFDTRLRWPKLLSGSAAEGIAHRLVDAGATMVAPAESFLVSRKPELEPGELERATAWATSLAEAVSAQRVPVSSPR